MNRNVFSQIESLGDEYIAWLKDLVAVPSPTGGEADAQRIVETKMRKLGVFVRLVSFDPNAPVPPHESRFFPSVRPEDPVVKRIACPDFSAGKPDEKFPGQFKPRQSYAGRPCVVGLLGKAAGPAFILNAHIDTAPVENSASWAHPPFSGHIDNGRLYGRGALDDKAGVAMMFMLAEAFLRADVSLPGRLILESVIEDEDTGNGTLACLQAGYACDAAIVIDGTWPYRIIDAHLGQLWLNGEVLGVPAAACSYARGQNPLDVTIALIAAWRNWTMECNCSEPNWEGISNPFFVNPGMLHGGVWAGAVPESARFSVQVGFPPPWTPATVLSGLERIAGHVLEAFKGVAINLHSGTLAAPPFANRNNALARLLEETIREVHPDEARQQQLRRVAVAGHCDLRHLRRADGSPADAVLYGPGGGANPHVRDEYYETSHFVPVAQNIAAAVLRWFEC